MSAFHIYLLHQDRYVGFAKHFIHDYALLTKAEYAGKSKSGSINQMLYKI